MYTIKKEFSFCASHQLEGLPLNHPCARLHGHNYVVKVKLKAKQLNEVGFVEDYRALDICKNWLDNNFGHQHLNDILENNYHYFNPTAENLARFLYEKWKQFIPELCAVSVSETPKTDCCYEPDND